MTRKAKPVTSEFGDPFDKTDFIHAGLYFLASGDYLFRWKDNGRVNQKCLTAPDVSAAFTKTEIDSGWVPAGIMRHGYGDRGPWAVLAIPPAREEITLLKPGGESETLSVMFPHLVMVGIDKVYYLVAMDGAFAPNNKACMAPFTNIHPDHKICWGTNVPPAAGVQSMMKAWRMFIELPFNGDLASGKSMRHDRDIRTAWGKFSRKHQWPVTDLVPTRQTVDAIIQNILRGSNYAN